MIKILQITALNDNYIYLLHGGGETAVIDPSLAVPVLEILEREGWQLDYILNTHHHNDHTGGNLELKTATGAKIVGYAGDAHRIPGIDAKLNDGDIFKVCGLDSRVMFIPGHTLGHIAYYFAGAASLFCGDTLFCMGCGRLFEGTFEQMFTSLAKIKALPLDTKIYCAHEYTESNGRFALTITPENQDLKARMQEVLNLRNAGKSTVPSTLDIELKTNPFLIAKDASEFATIRTLKDNF